MLFFFEIGFLALAVAAVVAGELAGPRAVLPPALVLTLISWGAWELLGRRPYVQAMRALREAAPVQRTPLPEDVVHGWLHLNKMLALGVAGLAVWALLRG
jgi:hypothetical protein